jgi:DNA-binding NarL/FixJ family response regulator
LTSNPIALSFSESHLVDILEQGQGADFRTDDDEPEIYSSLEEALLQKCRALAQAHNLSSREEEVLDRLVAGYNLRTIASELVISENTAKAHTKHIYQKLGIHTRQELVNYFRHSEMPHR